MESEREESTSAGTRLKRRLVGALCTPSWSLGLLLFCCLFLPSYQGCNGQAIHVYQELAPDSMELGELYQLFQLVWPFGFGLVVALGCGWLVWSSDPADAQPLWWCYAGLVAVHTALLAVQLPAVNWGEAVDGTDEFWLVFYWLLVSVTLAVLVPITGLRCRTWFNAAMWMQLALSVAAAISVSFVVPGLLFVNGLLWGGKLMVFSSVFLVVTTLLQRLDGYRSLTRDSRHSPLQLSLRSLLLLTALSGLASAWVGRILLEFS